MLDTALHTAKASLRQRNLASASQPASFRQISRQHIGADGPLIIWRLP
jgi:hypothetical protein